VLEWTHVTPSARVVGRSARRRRSAISATLAPAAPSCSASLRTVAPDFSAAYAIEA
jgi:hypothetical protein